jgi:hypothetical protein
LGCCFSFFVVDGEEQGAAIDELVRSRGLMLIAGSFNLAAGLAIVLGHNVWSGGALTVVVTLIGWLRVARRRLVVYAARKTRPILRGAAWRRAYREINEFERISRAARSRASASATASLAVATHERRFPKTVLMCISRDSI